MDGGYSNREEAGGGMTRSSMIYVLKAGSALSILSVNLDKLIKATKHRIFQRIISFVIEKVTFVIFKFFGGVMKKKTLREGPSQNFHCLSCSIKAICCCAPINK